MHWEIEDLEYSNDLIYSIEREKDIEASWQKWEEEQDNKNRLPAIIKIITPIMNNETQCNTRTIRGTHQEKL